MLHQPMLKQRLPLKYRKQPLMNARQMGTAAQFLYRTSVKPFVSPKHAQRSALHRGADNSCMPALSETLSIVTKSQSSGNLGTAIFSKKCEVENTNFSFLKSPSCPSFIIYQTKEGCLISYSEVFNITSSYYILSVQEVESTSGLFLFLLIHSLLIFLID